MFIYGHDLFWRESFRWRFAFPILFHFQCILITENLSSLQFTFKLKALVLFALSSNKRKMFS